MSINADAARSGPAEFRAAESERYFQLVFDRAPIAMALIGLDGRYERVNRAMTQFTGYSEQQLIGMTMADVTHPQDVEADVNAMADLYTGEGNTYTVDKRYITRSGKTVWGAKFASLVRRPDGSPVHIIAQIQDVTTRKLAEQELTQERRRLRDAESVAQAGSWEQDTATGAISWSAGLFELYGIDQDQFDGDFHTALTCIHVDDRAKVAAAVQATRTGQSGHVRYRVTRASDAALRWIEGRGRAVYEDGQLVRIGGAIVDVTDQVVAQSELAAAHTFQGAVFDASPDIIAVWDLDAWSIVWANRSVSEQLGYSTGGGARDDGLAVELVLDEDRTRLVESITAVRDARDGEVVHVDFRMRHQDGTIRWFSRRAAPLRRDEQGRVTHIVGLSHDSTAAKTTEAALSTSQALFRQLADSVSAAFLLRSWDPPEFLYVSPGYQKIFGYDPMVESEKPEQSLLRVHPDDRPRFLAEYWALSRAGIAATCDYRIVRADGEIRWVRATTAPVLDPQGHSRRSASTVEDVTTSRLAEQARTGAVEEANRANAAKDQFFSRTSHELRTPLNAVLGFAQLLEEENLSDDQHDAVSHILSSGRQLLGLVDVLLDISKVDSQPVDLCLEVVPIADLLAETVAKMTPTAAAAGVTIGFEPTAMTGRPVRADYGRLRQVMLNLMSNAIIYNRRGGHVAISIQIIDPHLEIVVSDTGRGIAAADLPRLFTPFDRLGAETIGIDGIGVGLALSQRLMTVMGGTLTATSQDGVGSTFTASIPLALENDACRIVGH